MNSQPIDPRGLAPIQGTPKANPAAEPSQGADSENPAFRVLLERLQVQAEALEEKSKGVDDPRQLTGAVDAARASLEDALSLGEELLEAFRKVQHQAPTDAQDTEENRS